MPDEGIVRGHRAVLAQADQRPGVIGAVLRARLLAAVTEGQEHVPGAVEYDASAEVASAPPAGALAEQYLDLFEPVVDQAAAGELGADAVAATRCVGQVHQTVSGEIGMRGDVEQAALTGGRDRRHALDRARVQGAVGRGQAQSARTLGDQHAPVRQPGDTPGMLEPAGEHDHAQRVQIGADLQGLRGGDGAGEHHQRCPAPRGEPAETRGRRISCGHRTPAGDGGPSAGLRPAHAPGSPRVARTAPASSARRACRS